MEGFKYLGATSKGRMEGSSTVGEASAVMCHDPQLVTEITRSRMQVDKIGLLRRISGFSLRDRVRSLAVREGLSLEPLLVAWASVQGACWTLPC